MGTTETKLNRLAQTKTDIRRAINSKGVGVDEETPFKDYAAKIEEITTASLNVFCQEAEPEVKDGIWIQGDREYSTVKVTDRVSNTPYWESTNSSTMPFAVSGHSFTRVQKGNILYILRSSTTSGYSYNLETGEYETIKYPTYTVNDTTSNFYPSWSCVKDDDIYMFGRAKKAFKYNTISKEWTQLSDSLYGTSNESPAVLVGDNIYLFYSGEHAYKYSITNDTYKKLSAMPHNCAGGFAGVLVGDKIYLLGGSIGSNIYEGTKGNAFYEYNIAKDTYTKLTDLTHYLQYGHCLAVAVGTDIYYMGSGNSNGTSGINKASKYDTVSKKHTALAAIPHKMHGGCIAYYNNKIYAIGGGSDYANYMSIMAFPVLDFKNNSVVIQSGDVYKTHFMTLPSIVDGGLETPFKDAFHYTDANGLDGTLPTYYGDGTQWNKFKN